MPQQEFERDEVRDRGEGRGSEQLESAKPKGLEWASAVGNAAVQRIARSPAGRTTPVKVGATPHAARALARQAEEEEEGGEGEGAVATAPPEAAEAEAAAPEGEGAAPEASASESAAPEAAAEAEPEEETE